MNSTNPLRQYFRRPALYFKLPSGGQHYPAGSIDLPENGELPVYPMTAIDEITSKTPDALFNGTAVIEIIKSCIPNIKDPWVIPSSDMDAIMIAIRSATNGVDLEIESNCPSCKEEGKYGVNLIGLLTNLKNPDYDTTLKIGELEFKYKPMTYRELNESNMQQFEVQRFINQIQLIEDDEEKTRKSSDLMKKMNEISITLIASAIEYIGTPGEQVTDKHFIEEYLRNCDRKSYEMIRGFLIKIKENSELKPLKVKCVHCDHEYSQTITLNVTDFFE